MSQKTSTAPPTHQKLTMLTYGTLVHSSVIASQAQNNVRAMDNGVLGMCRPRA